MQKCSRLLYYRYQSVERWALDRKVPGSNPVSVDSALHPSWSIK